MPTARTRANRKYNEKTYDQIKIQARKGTRDAWKTQAERRNMSLASLIQTAVAEYLERHPEPESTADADTP